MSIDTNKKSEFFSNLLKRAMKDNDWRQSKLAKEIGKDDSTVSKWISREQMPYTSTVINISNLLGYAVEEVGGIYQYEADSGPLSLTSEPKSAFIKDLNSILLEVLEESQEEHKAILGEYFLKVLHRYNRS